MIPTIPENVTTELARNVSPFPQRPAGTAPTEAPGKDIDVLGSLRRHWLIALATLVVVVGCGAALLWKKTKPTYEAHAVVYVSPKFPKLLSGDSEVELPYDSYVQDQIQTVTRYDIVADAVEKLPQSIRHHSGPALPAEVQALQNLLDVKRIGSTYEIEIGLEGYSAEGLAEIVNTVTDSYVDHAKNEEFYGRDERLATLRQEKDRLRGQMDEKLAEQADLMKQFGVATISSVEAAQNPYDSSSARLREQLATAHAQRQSAEAQLASVLKQGGPGAQVVNEAAADEQVAADPGLAAIRAGLNTKRVTLVEEMSGLLPANPTYKKDQESLATIDGQLKDLRRKAADNLQDRLRQNVASSRMVELELAKELGQKTSTASLVAPKIQRATELGPEIESLQKAYSAVEDRIRDLELESNSPGSMHVATKAMDPLGPQPTKMKKYGAVLLGLAMILTLGVPVGIDYFDGTIYTAPDVERVMGFHPIGVLLEHDDVRKEVSREYDFRLAAGIDHAIRTSGARTFLFTSPSHGNGTTSVVEKVGDKLSELGLRTLTIMASRGDELTVPPANVPLHKFLLSHASEPGDEMQIAALTPLTPYSEGPRNRPTSEETASRNPVLQALRQSNQQYDAVLIDASPLPLSANTEYLARVSDATVLVVQSSETTREELNRAARLLERLEVAGVAVVLNRVSVKRADRALKRELAQYEKRYKDQRFVTPEPEGWKAKVNS